MTRLRVSRRTCLVALAAPAVPRPPAAPVPPPRPAPGWLAVANVTLIDVAAGVGWPGATVLVRGDRIAAVGPAAAVAVPPTARVIDGRGKFLIPGLWDAHAHLADPGFYGLYLRAGVTGVRHMLGPNPLFSPAEPPDRTAGPVQPRVVRAHHALDGPDTPFPFPARPQIIPVARPCEVAAALDRVRAGRNDFVKVFSTLPPAVYRALLPAARARGLPVDGHLPRGVTAAEASAAGQRTIEHLDGVAFGCSPDEPRLRAELAAAPAGAADATGWRLQVRAHEAFDPARADALFRVFVANGTWHVPTLVQTRQMARLADPAVVGSAALRELPLLVRLYWERKVTNGVVELPRMGVRLTAADLRDRETLCRGDVELVRRMHRAGVRLLAGTDTPAPFVVPGAALHEELEHLVAAGLTPADALRAATLAPARCFGLDDRLGSIGPGKLADLVLLGRDPLADVRHTRTVEAVVVGGRLAVGGTPE